VFRIGLLSNPRLLVAGCFGIVLMGAISYAAPLQAVFNTRRWTPPTTRRPSPVRSTAGRRGDPRGVTVPPPAGQAEGRSEMRVINASCGRVGSTLAVQLVTECHNVRLIDRNAKTSSLAACRLPRPLP
jgi:hypothetical protein